MEQGPCSLKADFGLLGVNILSLGFLLKCASMNIIGPDEWELRTVLKTYSPQKHPSHRWFDFGLTFPHSPSLWKFNFCFILSFKNLGFWDFLESHQEVPSCDTVLWYTLYKVVWAPFNMQVLLKDETPILWLFKTNESGTVYYAVQWWLTFDNFWMKL